MTNLKAQVKRLRIYKKLRPIITLWSDSIAIYFTNIILSKFPSHTIRLTVLRMLGADIAKDVALQRGCQFWNTKGITIKKGSVIGFNVNLDERKGLKIGENVTIASEVMIWPLHHDYNDPGFCVIGNQVIIEDYAWICSRAIILPGITIGKGAVVGAGAVVVKDVAPYTVVGGIPAKQIAVRNSNLNYTPSAYKLHMV